MPTKELRKDITGLRAIAVLAVSFFHIAHVLAPDNNYFKGGFLGVDIFFVISGFLMTKIIMAGLDQGNFSLYVFYKRRAKRICPALGMVVLTFCLITFFIFDLDYAKHTFREGIRALGFISNFWYARNTGYFDLDATQKMFLHTWSLSVEWQFYLIYPVLLWLLSKVIFRNKLGLVLLILTLASLVFGCLYTVSNPTHSYYYLPSRAYELLIGSLAYFYPLTYFIRRFNLTKSYAANDSISDHNSNLAKYIEWTGLTCIIIALFIVDDSQGWPNAWSILPLAGVYLCIAADNKRTLLANPLFQNIGLWSYAIYLAHWPLIVICNKLNLKPEVWVLIPLIFALGIALHFGIERRRKFGWTTLACYLLLAGVIQVTISKNYFPAPSINYAGGEYGNNSSIEHYGNLKEEPALIMVGDSFARQYLGVIDAQGPHIISITFDNCFSSSNAANQPSSYEPNHFRKCFKRYQSTLLAVSENPNTPVVWAQNWDNYSHQNFLTPSGKIVNLKFEDIFKQELPRIASDWTANGNKLFILSIAPKQGLNTNVTKGQQCYSWFYMDNTLSRLLFKYFNCMNNKEQLLDPPINQLITEQIHSLNQTKGENASMQSVVYVDLSKALCDKKGCQITKERTFEPFFADNIHFAKTGAKVVFDYILQQVMLQPTAE